MNKTVKSLVSSLVVVFLAVVCSQAQGQSNKQPPRKAAAWVDPDKSEPAGMQYQTFTSNTIKAEVSYLIYLPPGYDKDKERRYPVVYWLHGRGGNQRGCGTTVRKLETAIRGGKAPAMIVVGVNGLPYSSYVDSADGKTPVQSVIVKDLIPHIDGTYRTVAQREGRAIEGFSMGGAGAAKIGFKYPELFGVVSLLAGAVHDVDSIKAKGNEVFETIYGGDNEYFQANSPWILVEKNAKAIRDKTHIRIVVGDKDPLLKRNRDFHALLEKLEILHQFDEIPGVGHNPGPLYDGLGVRAAAFYDKAFEGVTK